jgi:hypothetical protein
LLRQAENVKLLQHRTYIPIPEGEAQRSFRCMGRCVVLSSRIRIVLKQQTAVPPTWPCSTSEWHKPGTVSTKNCSKQHHPHGKQDLAVREAVNCVQLRPKHDTSRNPCEEPQHTDLTLPDIYLTLSQLASSICDVVVTFSFHFSRSFPSPPHLYLFNSSAKSAARLKIKGQTPNTLDLQIQCSAPPGS